MAHCEYCKQEIRLGPVAHRCAGRDAAAKEQAEARRSAAACSPDDLRVRDADATEIFVVDSHGQRYSGASFGNLKSAHSWIALQKNRDSLRVAMTAKFILENAEPIHGEKDA